MYSEYSSRRSKVAGSVNNAWQKFSFGNRKANKALTGQRNAFGALETISYTVSETSSSPKTHAPSPTTLTAIAPTSSKDCGSDSTTWTTLAKAPTTVSSAPTQKTAGISAQDWTKVESKKVKPAPIQPVSQLKTSSYYNKGIGRSAATFMQSTNWRARAPEVEEARHAVGTIGQVPTRVGESGRSRMTCNFGPRTIDGVLHADQTAGAILWHPDVRRCPDPKKVPKGWKAYQENGVWWMWKGRYWLVVESDKAHVWEAPVFTNNDKGLSRVDQERRREYMSVRPKHIDPQHFNNQSPTNEVLSIEYMKYRDAQLEGKLVRTTMVVHCTEVRKRPINHSPLRLVGAMSAASADALPAKSYRFVK
ncbi:hypothetical protein LTR37_011903 [Vermiconidia calcicola]|uniref:Uncharacterized protein n=1 Tax=Vermiconidia calcicola TaxID=1690605 RepID=A0ACC3N3H4_9PEZI|nr:hypothetical protein LTR37_011903 [Vermiconidia calcicola]